MKGSLLVIKELGFSPATIIDVGAQLGTPPLYDVFPESHHIMLEPIEEYMSDLQKICSKLPNAEFMHTAVVKDKKIKSITIKVKENYKASQIVDEKDISSSEWSGWIDRTVPAITLDDLCQLKSLPSPFLVKIDVDGKEVDVLSGGETTLSQAEYVIIESTLFHQFHSVMNFMQDHGFVVYDIVDPLYRPVDNALWQVDVAFVKQNSLFRQIKLYVNTKQERDDLDSRFKQYKEKLRTKVLDSDERKHIEVPVDKHKSIFIQIPRTASVPIAKSLFGNLAGGHTKIREYQKKYNETEFEERFKFTFVRNPWSRLVATYNFLSAGNIGGKDKQWVENNLKKYQNFDSFVKGWLNRENVYTSHHFIPQFEFVCIEGLEPAVNFIGHFENLEEDFKFVADKLGIQVNKSDSDKIVEIFVNENKDYTEYYTDETAKIVADVYREDIEIFGYDFGQLNMSNFRENRV